MSFSDPADPDQTPASAHEMTKKQSEAVIDFLEVARRAQTRLDHAPQDDAPRHGHEPLAARREGNTAHFEPASAAVYAITPLRVDGSRSSCEAQIARHCGFTLAHRPCIHDNLHTAGLCLAVGIPPAEPPPRVSSMTNRTPSRGSRCRGRATDFPTARRPGSLASQAVRREVDRHPPGEDRHHRLGRRSADHCDGDSQRRTDFRTLPRTCNTQWRTARRRR